ncbi:MAG: hypothetical protein GC159_13890 [Phycisphaera sp.]|nr:hypothetical protein [Phycisphaera sp.]
MRTAAIIAAVIIGLGARAAEAAAPRVQVTRSTLADQVTLAADRVIARYGHNDTTRPDALLVARALLEQAVSLDGEASAAWRRLAFVAEAQGDTVEQRRAITSYLRLEPLDDRMQLRLIDMMLAEKDTVDQRLTMLEHLAEGPGSERLTGALRSRLALRAAHLCARRGGDTAMAPWLARAIDLDETNKAAAAEALALLMRRGGTAEEEMAALVSLLAADPADASTHALIGSVLLNLGRYDAATDWLSTSESLARASSSSNRLVSVAQTRVTQQRILAMWGAGRRADAFRVVDGLLAERDAAAGPGLAASDGDVLALLSTAAAMQLAEPPTQPGAPPRRDYADELLSAMQRRFTAADGDARLIAAVDLVWWGLLVDRNADAADAAWSTIVAKLGVDDATRRRLEAWRMMRAGHSDEARRSLASCADSDGACALGLAMLERGEARAARLASIFAREPGSLIGLLARDGLVAIGREPGVAPERSGADAARVAAIVPDALRHPANAASNILALNIQPYRRSSPWQPWRVRVTLSNLSGMPVSLANDVEATRVLIVLTQDAGDEAVSCGQAAVDLGCRLRLDPNRSVSVDAVLDVASMPPGPLALHAILDPTSDGLGAVSPGVLGGAATCRGVERWWGADRDESATGNAWVGGREELAEAYESSDPMGRIWLAMNVVRHDVGLSLTLRPTAAAAEQHWTSVLGAIAAWGTCRGADVAIPGLKAPELLKLRHAVGSLLDDPQEK